MKNVIKSVLGAMILGAVLFSCKVETHEHTYSNKWSSNETEHWHAATCEHRGEVSGKAKHTWKLTATTIPATIITKGEGEYTCSVCKRTKTDEIPELYSLPIDAETGEAASKDSTYVYFGVFPKTVLSAESTVTVDETVSFSMGANTYYKGSDGEWYAKITAKPCGSSNIYSDGVTVTSTESYFKVEPIKWKMLTTDYNGTGKALLLAEDILTANVPYYKYNSSSNTRTVGSDTGIYPNNYKYSQIRAYLNGLDYYYDTSSSETTKKTDYTDKGFLQTAFTTSAQALIAETAVDNSDTSTTDTGNYLQKATKYVCANTTDKIFLLSEQEVTTTAYGFAAYYSSGKGNARIRVTTDYARANYAYQNTTAGYGGYWWLRSPFDDYSNIARNVGDEGHPTYNYGVNCTFSGVVPALSISLQ